MSTPIMPVAAPRLAHAGLLLTPLLRQWRRTLQPRHPRALIHAAQVVVIGGVVWGAIWFVAMRMFRAFLAYPEIANALTLKTLSLALATGGGITLIATTIAALGVCYKADDVRLLLVAPVDWLQHALAQLVQIAVHGGWALGLVFAPVLAALASVQGPTLSFVVVALLGAVLLLLGLAALGMLTALGLARIGSLHRARGLLVVGGVALVGLGLVLLRSSAPATLLVSGDAASAQALMQMLAEPTAPWLPTDWWARALLAARGGVDWLALGALLGASLLVITLAAAVMGRWYREALARAAAGGGIRHLVESPAQARRALRREKTLGPMRAAVLLKDLVRLRRETAEWSHGVLAAFGLVVYLVNIRALPVAGADPLSRFFAQVVALLNLAVGTLLLASLAAHYVLPSLSLEGRSLWLARLAPVDWSAMVRTKFTWGLTLLSPVTLAVTVLANWLLGVSPGYTVLAIAIALSAAVGVVALALWFGARYPRFDAKNPAEIASGIGATLFTLVGMGMALLVAMLAAPFVLTTFGDPSALPRGAAAIARWPAAVRLAGVALALGGPLVVAAAALPAAARRFEEALIRAGGDPHSP